MKENITLGDIATIQTGPFGSQLHASDYVENGIPVIMPTNIGNNLNIEVDAIAKINEDDLYRLSRYQVYEDDIVYSRRGDVERCAFITKSQNNWLVGTGCLRVRFKKGDIVPKFFAYQLSTDEAKGWISGHAVGSTMPNLNSSILAQVPLFKPDVKEQRAIAAVLSSLDDKIDLLHRQNVTLEAMAEALFKQWFVVEAKEEWKHGFLPDEFEFVMGQSPNGYSFNGVGMGIPMFQGNADFGFRFPSERIYTTEPTRFAQKFDTLISVRAPVGAQNMAQERCCIGRGLAAFRYKNNSSFYSYTYFKLRYLLKEISVYNDEGTVFGSISKNDFNNIEIIIPDYNYVLQFENIILSINNKVISNCQQINILEKLRDTLLPKLMSGEVRVDC